MDTFRIDINCDVGEGIGNEPALLPHISSCSIACGGHAGNARTMRQVVRLAKRHGVRIGAHPSFPDKHNFGRVSLNIPKDALIRSIRSQVRQLETILREEDARLHHIKPHGALYNDAAKETRMATTVLEALEGYRDNIFLYAPFGSEIAREAEKRGHPIKYEVFGDRNYGEDLGLLPRTKPDALIEDPEAVLDHVLSMVKEGQVKTLSGHRLPIRADTCCIHGDTAKAFEIVSYLSRELPNHNIRIST